MGVDACIASGPGEILVLAVGNVEVGLGVTILLSQPKINDIDLVASLANAHEEVIRFDIPMDEGFRMDVFDARNELVRQQQHRLQ